MLKRFGFIAVIAFAFTINASAQSTFHTTFLSSYDAATGKIMQLADAFAEDQYSWRPAEGVRSVSEAMMHVASANFFFASMLGADMPEGVNPQEFEAKITTKKEASKMLKKSIELARKAVENTSLESMEEEIDLFGNQTQRMRLVLLVGDHANEHLGQLIAYARSAGVVPPWSN